MKASRSFFLSAALAGLFFSFLENALVASTGKTIPLPLLLASSLTTLLIVLLGAGLSLLVGALLPVREGVKSRQVSFAGWFLLALMSSLFFYALPELEPLSTLPPRAQGLSLVALAACGILGSAFAAVVASGVAAPTRGGATRAAPIPTESSSCATLMVGAFGLWVLLLLAALNRGWLPELLAMKSLVVDAGVVLVGGILAFAMAVWLRESEQEASRPFRRSMGLVIFALLACGLSYGTSWLEAGAEAGKSEFPSAQVTRRGGTPTVVLIVLDTVRADVLSPFGGPPGLTPSLEALARDSVVYRRAVAASSWTLPSVASILTGQPPSVHLADRGYAYVAAPRATNSMDAALVAEGGVDGLGDLADARPMRTDIPTLSSLLEEATFRTAAFVANAGYLHPDFGLDAGFERYQARPRLILRRRPLALEALKAVAAVQASQLTRWCRISEDILLEAGDWLESVGASDALLVINLMDAHDPYTPPSRYDRRPGRAPRMKDPFFPVMRGERLLKAEEASNLRAAYEGALAYQDAALGAFIRRLKGMGRYDDALLVVVSDHGELFGEHGMLRHGLEVWQDLVQVPLLVKYPRAVHQGEVWQPVHHVDLLPTILEQAGVTTLLTWPGRVLPLPEEEAASRPLLTTVFSSPVARQVLGEQWDKDVACVILWPLKYCRSSRGEGRLFDVGADPAEALNLLPTRPADVATLEALLSALLADAASPAGGAPSSVTGEAMEQLRALGYVQ